MKNTLKKFAVLSLLILACVGLNSCDSDDGPWWGPPPYGWDSFQDGRLEGYWQLVQYNTNDVPPSEANYMYFNGNGFGRYYYLDNGYRDSEQIRYYCQDSVNGASDYQINIQYQYSSTTTMNYWFHNGRNTLIMQWRTGGGRVEQYVYDRIPNAPW